MSSYKDRINALCGSIHTGLVDFDEPRSEANMPTQASSEFITNKQQGDWAEDVIFRAVNSKSENIVAVKYGKSDNLVAGDPGFKEFFESYQRELDTIGKRPDILLFKKEDFNPDLGYDISRLDGIDDYIKKAIAGVEVRSSSFLIDKYNAEANEYVMENTRQALTLRDEILNGYKVLLIEKKKKELISLLELLNEESIQSLSFNVPSWSSSARLEQLKELLSRLKSHMRNVKKRNTLSITPKAEDLKVVRKWIMTYGVPHYYVQVFFDKVYGISFENILELISNPELEDNRYTVEKDAKNQNKTTIKIPSQDGVCLAQKVDEPNHSSVRKELGKGRLLFYVTFDGGAAYIDKSNFEELFNCKL